MKPDHSMKYGGSDAMSEGLVPSPSSKTIRRVRAIESLSNIAPDPQVTAQSLATMPAFSGPILMNHNYPVLQNWSLTALAPNPSSKHRAAPAKTERNRESAVLDEVLHLAELPGTLLTPRNQTFQSFQCTKSTTPRNVLKKRSSRPSDPKSKRPCLKKLTDQVLCRTQNPSPISKSKTISEPSRPVHLSGSLISQPHNLSRRPSCRINSRQHEKERRRDELKASALQGDFATPEDAFGSYPCGREVPIIIEPELEASITVSPHPPSSESSISSRPPALSPSSRLTVDSCWQISYDHRHKENVNLRRQLDAAVPDIKTLKSNQKILKERCTRFEEEAAAARRAAAREKKTSEHLKWAYDIQTAKLEALQDELQALKEAAERQSPPRVQVNAVPARQKLRRSPAPVPEKILELSAGISHQILRKPCPAPQAKTVTPIELSATVSHQALRPAAQESKSLIEVHELAATASHGILRDPKREPKSREYIPYQLPSFETLRENFSDILPRDENEVQSQNQDKEHEVLPDSPTIPHINLAGIRNSIPLSDAEEEPVSPITPTRASQGELRSPVSPQSSLRKAIFRFGSRRIEKVPAVFRVPLAQERERDRLSVLPGLATWEWSSVPDLKLGDLGRW